MDSAQIINGQMIQPFLWALAGGVIPVLFWLWFWLREDKLNPEPKALIILAFLGGIIAVILSFFTEAFSDKYFITRNSIYFTMLLTPFVEEIFKYFTARVLVLNRSDNDEPIDPVIYMITAALGFAALENAMFILDPIVKGDFTVGLATGNLRFVGATLLHTISSATVGMFMGFTFYRGIISKKVAILLGLIIAMFLHGSFNYFIINGTGYQKIFTFGGVWLFAVILLFVFEKIKKVNN